MGTPAERSRFREFLLGLMGPLAAANAEDRKPNSVAVGDRQRGEPDVGQPSGLASEAADQPARGQSDDVPLGLAQTPIVQQANQAEEIRRLASIVESQARHLELIANHIRGGGDASNRTANIRQEVPSRATEEELQVGEREVQGGVRVRTEVTERPVEEQVNLREERVKIERRPASPPSDDFYEIYDSSDAGFMNPIGKSPVDSKVSRVTEEVVIGKIAGQGDHTVRGTVRKTDFDVEPINKSASQDVKK